MATDQRTSRQPTVRIGWKSLGVLELTALPSIDRELWVPMVQGTDALLVGERAIFRQGFSHSSSTLASK